MHPYPSSSQCVVSDKLIYLYIRTNYSFIGGQSHTHNQLGRPHTTNSANFQLHDASMQKGRNRKVRCIASSHRYTWSASYNTSPSLIILHHNIVIYCVINSIQMCIASTDLNISIKFASVTCCTSSLPNEVARATANICLHKGGGDDVALMEIFLPFVMFEDL